MTPPETAILAEMQATGFDRLICIRRLQARRSIR